MLTQHEQLRYGRQIMLPTIGERGQVALSQAKVLIVGLGGLGNPVSMYLAGAGIGTLYLADGDDIELSNLQRQVLFNQQDIGKNKADCAAEKLRLQNPDIEIEIIDEMFDLELGNYYLSNENDLNIDLIIDCTDNIQTRYLLNQLALSHKVPLIIGAATGFDGQTLFINPQEKNSACYQCLFPESQEPPENNCQTLGILGPVLSIIAGMQALMAIKHLAGIPVESNRLQLFDGLTQQWQQFNLSRQNNCPACYSK